MKYAIKTLENALHELNKPIPENTEYKEEDLIGAVLHNRQISDIKFALKILKGFAEDNKTYMALRNNQDYFEQTFNQPPKGI